MPDLSDLHTKTLYLHGLMAVLTDFDPHDRRTSNGANAVAYAAEGLADEIARDMEKLMEAGQ
ncbi:hypothetical protein [Mameliella sp.]|uniref:hypothetical protein n=1 Tax=Mameliella sp. TaxID=1924940 RepID=UPI003BAB6A1C